MFVVGQSFGLHRFFAAGCGEAEHIADLAHDIETRLYAGFLTPEEGSNPANRYGTLPYDEAQAQIPEMDFGLYLDQIGCERPDGFYMFEPSALPALSEV